MNINLLYRQSKIKLRWLMVFVLINACVERIYFDVPSAQLQMVVEGMVSDNPGPYTVKVSKGLSLEADTTSLVAFTNLKIKLFDDLGNEEAFVEKNPGVYLTNGLLKGVVGRSYHIRIETSDGRVFESSPEKISPSGEIENIRHEFEARTSVKKFGEVNADVFNVFVDSKASENAETYVRWRFKGTYKVITYPELNYTFIQGYTPYKNPYPCSGYYIGEGPPGSGGVLVKFAECSCCTCYPNDVEQSPQLSDTQLIDNNEFKNVKVGEIAINSSTFYEKYLVEVEQMSLSRKAYNFFKLVREQKINSSSIFQPPSGELIGNMKAINSNEVVIGLFWATSIKKKNKFIYPSDIPYSLAEIEFSTLPCYSRYRNASTVKPDNW